MTPAGAEAGLGTTVGTVQATLGEHKVIALVIQRQQQVKLRVFQGEVFVRVQLHAGGAEVAQPLLKCSAGLDGGHIAGHGRGGVTFCTAGQEAASL